MKIKINRRDHLKTLKCLLLLALMPASLAFAQSIPIANLCGTGRNPACNGLQPIGSVDAHWNLATPYPTSPSGQPVPLPSTLTYGPAYVNTPNGSWLANGPDTQWITPQVTTSLGGNYVYETTFDIPSGYDPATATISGWWSSDNEGIAVWLNDTLLAGFPLPGPSGFNAMTNFTIAQGVAGATFRPCSNKLFFVLRNRGVGGVDANPTDTGLRVQFTGSAVLPLPPPTLGNYPDTTLLLSGDTTVTPDATPSSTTSINVSTSTNFKGLLEGDPATGVVRVTNAHPAGIYTVTVTAFNGCTTTMTTFTLTVMRPPPCNPVDQIAFSRTTLSAGTAPRSVAIGDFDGDGIQDLALGLRVSSVPLSQGKVSIFLGKGANGKGTGTFRLQAFDYLIGTTTSNSTPNSLVVGDFDGDGRPDIATANSGSANVSVLLNNTTTQGSPVFLNAVNYDVGAQPRSIAVGDFNGDNIRDLAVTNENSRSVSVLLGNGNGTFQTAINLDIGTGLFPYWVTVGDFDGFNGNGDGKPDIAVTTRTPDSKVLVLLNTTAPFPNPGVTFRAPIPFGVENDPLSVVAGNFDAGLSNDLATANQGVNGSAGNVSVLLNATSPIGVLNFAPITSFPAGTSPQSLAVGQFDDLSQDLVVANNVSNNVSILLNNGSGGFLFPKNFLVGTSPSSVAVGDFNGDGRQDLAVANFSSDSVSILLRRPCPCAATFAENFDVPPSLPPRTTPRLDGRPRWMGDLEDRPGYSAK